MSNARDSPTAMSNASPVAIEGCESRANGAGRWMPLTALIGSDPLAARMFAKGFKISERKPHVLVLSRKKYASVMIGDDIKITVVDISGSRVKLAFNAPKNVRIYRSEVYEALEAERDAGEAA